MTITALITAISMTIIGIALAIKFIIICTTGGFVPIHDKTHKQSTIKDVLIHLSDCLKELASKSAIAIPGLIGSIVSFIFRRNAMHCI